MSDAILVLNAGSSSLKFTEFLVGAGEALEAYASGSLEELNGRARFRARDASGAVVGEHEWSDEAPPQHAGALEFLFEWLQSYASASELAAVGHRVVHGGADYAAPVRVDPTVLAKLDQLVPLAPLHQPHNLLPIRVIAERRPGLAQVACFDTAFHQTAPALLTCLRAAALDHRARGAALRLPRPVIRVYREHAAGTGCAARRPARPWCCTSATARACAP